MKRKPGDIVERMEDRTDVLAEVLVVDEYGSVLIAYVEGGQGWWPSDCLLPPVSAGDPSTPG